MNKNDAKRVFSRIGFAQIAGILASVLVGTYALAPLVTDENLQNTFETFGPSMLLLMIYVPQFAYLLAFWLFVRTMPKPE